MKTIDNNNALRSDGYYDYGKRNLTTSHVHAMLFTSILTVMDGAEIIIFLNTQNSVPKLNDVMIENDSYTLSPWIYAEIMATNYLRRKEWNKYRIQKCMEFAHRENVDELKIAYKLPTEGMSDLDADDLINWEAKHTARINEFHGGIFARIHPLNYLYEVKFGKEE